MLKIFLITACILSAALFFTYQSTKITKVTHGFTGNYVFSKNLLTGENLAISYDTTYFYSKINEYGIQNVKDLPNIPTSSLLYIPVAFFKPETAKIIWNIFNLILYFLSIHLLLNIFELKLSNSTSLFLILISFLFYPAYNNLNLGQIYIFFLFLFCVSIYGFKTNNIILIALPLSLMLIFRGYGVIPLIFLASLKKWKEVGLAIAIAFGLIMVSLPVIGIDAWKQYFIHVPLKMGHDVFASHTAYQTINSFIRHILLGWSELIYSLTLFVLTVSFVVLLIRQNIKNISILFYSSSLLLNVILAPVAEDYHYMLLLPSIFAAGVILFDNYKDYKLEISLLILALILLSVPFNYKGLNETALPLILLAYPRLYAGLLFILLYFLLSRKTNRPAKANF